MKKIIKPSFGMIEVLCKGINWATIPAIALIIDTEKYGAAVLIYTLLTIYSSLIIFGQSRTVLKFYDDDHPWIITATATIITTSSLLMFFIALASKIENPLLIIIASTLIAMHTALSLKLRATNKIKEYFSIRLSYVSLRAILSTASLTLSENTTHYLLAEIAATTISLTISRGVLKETAASFMRISKQQILIPLKLGAPLFIQTISSLSIAHFDKLLVSEQLGTKELGQYAFLFSIASSIAFINTYYATQYEISIYRSPTKEKARDQANIFAYQCLRAAALISPALFLIYLASTQLNKEINFLPLTFSIVLAGQLLASFSLRGSYLLTHQAKTMQILAISTIASTINIASNIILIPIQGVNGAALSSLISNAILAISINIAPNIKNQKNSN